MGLFLKAYTDNILYCSHTRAAAQNAISRWPAGDKGRVDIQTLHSVCFRALGFSKAQTIDHAKLEAFGKEYGIDMSNTEGQEGLGLQFLEVISFGRARRLTIEKTYEVSMRPGSAEQFFAFAESYTKWKHAFGYVDFDDMLVLFNIRRPRIPRYGLVVIDEAQDLTPLQWSVVDTVQSMLPQAQVVIAGDDDQSLFVWAGSDSQGMPRWEEKYQASRKVLSQSYRVPRAVFDLAQEIIARVLQRVPKEYSPRDADGSLVRMSHVDYLVTNIDRSRDSMLLYNDRYVRAEAEVLLRDALIPYKALNGMPAPLDTKVGQAIRVCEHYTIDQITGEDELRNQVGRALNTYGRSVMENVGLPEIVYRLRQRDFAICPVHPSNQYYLRGIDARAPQNLRLSTFYGAKGLEADDVHLILSLSQAAWASAAIDPDSLHRLIYTAVTRAKERLFIYDGENGYELPGGSGSILEQARTECGTVEPEIRREI